jgi:hypothetical protein
MMSSDPVISPVNTGAAACTSLMPWAAKAASSALARTRQVGVTRGWRVRYDMLAQGTRLDRPWHRPGAVRYALHRLPGLLRRR